MSTSFRIAIAGLGTVGVGVIKILTERADLLAARLGRPIEITGVSARERKKDRGIDINAYGWADDPMDFAARDDVDCVVELIGGSDGVAKALAESTLQNGKHFVTANKALIAHHGAALATLAEQNNAALTYEAAVAGGIPVIKALREGLAGNNARAVYGILNGTCNYILSEMRETGRSFEDVLKDAQELGYAEADPSFDVGGIDAGHKCAILAALAFGVAPDFEALSITGIEHITAADIGFADELGYRIKLLGVARLIDGQVLQTVRPCLVPTHSALGAVEGVFNAVSITADPVDKIVLEGRGAGEGPTASAVVSDICDLVRGQMALAFGVPAAQLQPLKAASAGSVINQYYMHLRVQDQPGVIADVSAILRDHDISIESLVQRIENDAQPVSVVILTHDCSAEQSDGAIAAIGDLPAMVDKPTLLPLEHL